VASTLPDRKPRNKPTLFPKVQPFASCGLFFIARDDELLLFLDKFAEFAGSGVKTTRIIKVFLCAVPNRLNVVLSVLYQQKALERRNQSSPVFSWHAIPSWVPRCRAVRKANTATKWA
jgi:hypothetical protein